MDNKTFGACLVLSTFAAMVLLPVAGMAQEPAAGKVERLSVRVGDRDRSYARYVPAKARPGQPLVIALHGSSATGEAMRRETGFGFEKLANQHGFVVAYPDGFLLSWNDCRKHNQSPARAWNFDDVGFLRQLIRAAVAEHGSDPARVFLFGFSGGAHMAYRMAWEAPLDIAAIAAVGGNLPMPDALTCGPNGKTPRVVMIKGRADELDLYDGGPHPASGNVLSAHESAAAFAKQNGLLEPTAEVDAGRKTRLLAWPKSGRPLVALYSVEGLGHVVPIEGRDEVDGVALAWKFFTAP